LIRPQPTRVAEPIEEEEEEEDEEEEEMYYSPVPVAARSKA